MKSSLKRRAFLSALGAAPFGLPFLSSFRTAKAQETAGPRVLFLMSPNDSLKREVWGFASEGQSAALPATLPSYLEPLSAFSDRISMYGDLVKEASHNSHCPQSLLPGTDTLDGTRNTNASSISLDQFLAEEFGVDAATFGVRCIPNAERARWSSRGPNQPVDPVMDPAVAFDQYFADFSADPAEADALRERKRSLLDRVAKDLNRFQSELPASKRPQLEAHLEAVRKLETDIDSNIAAGCDPGDPTQGDSAADNASVPRSLHGLVDMMVQLFACDVTRVGSIQFGRTGAGEIRPTWPEFGIDINRDCHFGLAHRYWEEPSPESTADRIAQERWVCEHMVQRLVEGLEAMPDDQGGTILDNTLIVWLHEMGEQHKDRGHNVVLIGGPPVLDGGMFHSLPGRSLNDLFTGVAQRVGVDIPRWGDPSYNDSPISI